MARKLIAVKTLHNYTIEELTKIEEKLQKNSKKALLRAVIMRYQGIHTAEIAKIINRSIASVTIYINKWNTEGIDSLIDNWGGSTSTFTDEMFDDLRDTVINKSPSNYGFLSNTWDTHMLSQYIARTFGKEYSSEWIRQMLIKIGFSYKRGQYKPTKGNPELQAGFKKSCWTTRHN
jgi:transposase